MSSSDTFVKYFEELFNDFLTSLTLVSIDLKFPFLLATKLGKSYKLPSAYRYCISVKILS